jgi:hypothetical protein
VERQTFWTGAPGTIPAALPAAEHQQLPSGYLIGISWYTCVPMKTSLDELPTHKRSAHAS